MEPIPFRALLVSANKQTRDGRMIEAGALTWTCPMTLLAAVEDQHGGEQPPTQIVGRIDEITLVGDDYIGTGQLTTDVGIYTVAPMIADNTLNGVSVDLAPMVVEIRANGDPMGGLEPDAPTQETPEESAAPPAPEVEEAMPVHRESVDDFLMVIVEGEIIAATICAKPAMAGATIALVTPGDPAAPALPDAPAPAVAAGASQLLWRTFALIAATPPADAPAADAAPATDQPDYTGSAMICLRPPEAASLAVDGGTDPADLHITLAYLGDAADLGDSLTELQSICDELASGLEAGTGRIAGPAAFVNDPDPDEPATAQTPLVALIDSQWIAQVYAGLMDALSASGIDTPTDHGFLPHMTLQYAAAPSLLAVPQTDLTFPAIHLVIGTDDTPYACGSAVTASACQAAPEEPPAAWFSDPKLNAPTPLHVDDDGRVYGHIATWNTCHTGISGRCVRPPRSQSGYAYFHLGQIRCDDGQRFDVGQITLDTRHASLAATRREATLHYDHTGHAVADVRAGEDKHGIWIAGAVRPDVAMTTLRKFRGAKISGDWRTAQGRGLELVAALAVNIPGFPVPRPQARTITASGEITALVTGEIEPATDYDAQIRALSFMAVHGEHTIDALAASAHAPAETIDGVIATLEA